MIDLTYEQKLAAMNALRSCSVHMREPHSWYVSQPGVEIKNGSVLQNVSGNGDSPGAAIEDHWEQLIVVPAPRVIVLDAMRETRKYVRWNGFMWVEIPRETFEQVSRD